MRKIKFKIYCTCLLLCLVVGCGGNINKITSSDKTVNDLKLIQISDSHWYDPDTMIVYLWNGHFSNASTSIAPSAYMAPNGLPYKYSKEFDYFVEIDPISEWGLDKLVSPDEASK